MLNLHLLKLFFLYRDLASNIGQSISVYLGLCLYDFHKLFGFFFNWYNVYKDGDTKKIVYVRKKTRFDSLISSTGANFGRKLSEKIDERLNSRLSNGLNSRLSNRLNSKLDDLNDKSKDRINRLELINKSLTNNKSIKIYNLNSLDNLSQKIKTFDSIQNQFKELQRNYNLQSINKDLLLFKSSFKYRVNN